KTAALRKRFLETIQRYQDVERLYDQKYRQRVERQIRIVKPNATQEEVDRFIDSDDSPQVFAQSELHQLFSDMQMMVEQQGETVTNIEQHAETTVGDLKQGNTFLTKAIASARATRHVS
ncbi:t-SNARE, partial [Lichtheimia hyalospora FSU 10163]